MVPKSEKKRVDNRAFAETDKQFQRSCEKAGVSPTKRQASKYRRKVGLAYREGR